jgi:hypothetical protein
LLERATLTVGSWPLAQPERGNNVAPAATVAEVCMNFLRVTLLLLMVSPYSGARCGVD